MRFLLMRMGMNVVGGLRVLECTALLIQSVVPDYRFLEKGVRRRWFTHVHLVDV